MMELMYSSVLRPREIYNLKLNDMDFKKGLLFIEQSKNRKDRIVPVGKEALFWTKKYLKEVRTRYIKTNSHNYLFINNKPCRNYPFGESVGQSGSRFGKAG